LLVYLLARKLFITVEDATRDVTVERVLLAWTLAGAALIAVLLSVINAAFDYAKIATVLEGRQSMLPAALRGFRFVLARPARTLGLYLALGAIGLLLLAGYSLIAPGARRS